MRVLALAALLAACRSPQEPAVATAEPVVDAAPQPAASQPIDATTTASGCPPSFRAAETASCVLGKAPSQCAYGEGDCHCNPPPQCGGAFMAHPPGTPGQFYCTPKLAGMLRADGCAYTGPTNGAQCAKEGQTCAYGPCSWSRATATCKSGVWVVTQYHGPPPP